MKYLILLLLLGCSTRITPKYKEGDILCISKEYSESHYIKSDCNTLFVVKNIFCGNRTCIYTIRDIICFEDVKILEKNVIPMGVEL